MEIGKIIRYYRELVGFTQQELAEKTYLSDKTIGHYETGARIPSLDKVQIIAEALGQTIQDFMQFKEEMTIPIEFIRNPYGISIIKETKNVLAIKELIAECIKDQREEKIIMIIEDHEKLFLDRENQIIETIMLRYRIFRKYIHFYLGKYEEEKIKNLLVSLKRYEWEANDIVKCIYNYKNHYTISEGQKYTVSSIGSHEVDDYETVEIVTHAGGRGTYPREWFEFYEKGNPNQPVPKNDFLNLLYLLSLRKEE